ncbi:MAG: OsmC family protein [Gammaproteobacteria bacterium]|uniref:OsmC family protein n=1 Tax=Limnobacter sp. TaxID=2003368 RepID=UPI001D43C798|nr:OsmC family protein [Gammaproteobacteria bacterium]MBU0848696.1 OsmC family protein [Gammaproteobacteria bacterium]MBU1268474.1 OsmC family protein [Gammaproteobacteria bacterium]MBU1528755.1 OsmC family protein [Gammaproteobacteria bacterium]MBU1779094.1 OsmC family protein [Gammaproteobacteria bacterium]
MNVSVPNAQREVRALYKEDPSAAMVTDHALARGADPSDPFHSVVEPMDGCGVQVPIGVHRALGGLHDAPTPGDMLCAALAACQDSAMRMVANVLGVELVFLEVRVTADVDVRGTLNMSPDVPVGFQSMRCDVQFKVKEGTPADLIKALTFAAKRCCVVQQTLKTPPKVETSFQLN